MLECHASDNAGGKAGNRWGVALGCLVGTVLFLSSCMYLPDIFKQFTVYCSTIVAALST
jgi:hypothetical protein